QVQQVLDLSVDCRIETGPVVVSGEPVVAAVPGVARVPPGLDHEGVLRIGVAERCRWGGRERSLSTIIHPGVARGGVMAVVCDVVCEMVALNCVPRGRSVNAYTVGIVEAVEGSVLPYVVVANGVAAGVMQQDAAAEIGGAAEVVAIALDLVSFQSVVRGAVIEPDSRAAILLGVVLSNCNVVRQIDDDAIEGARSRPVVGQ